MHFRRPEALGTQSEKRLHTISDSRYKSINNKKKLKPTKKGTKVQKKKTKAPKLSKKQYAKSNKMSQRKEDEMVKKITEMCIGGEKQAVDQPELIAKEVGKLSLVGEEMGQEQAKQAFPKDNKHRETGTGVVPSMTSKQGLVGIVSALIGEGEDVGSEAEDWGYVYGMADGVRW